jgi:hypothetical protein
MQLNICGRDASTENYNRVSPTPGDATSAVEPEGYRSLQIGWLLRNSGRPHGVGSSEMRDRSMILQEVGIMGAVLKPTEGTSKACSRCYVWRALV